MDNKQLLFDIHEKEQNRVSTNDEPAKKSSGSTSELNDKLSHLEVLEMLAPPPRESLDSNSDESLTEITECAEYEDIQIEELLDEGNTPEKEGNEEKIYGPDPIVWTLEKALSMLKLNKYGPIIDEFIMDQSNHKLDKVEFLEQGICALAKEKWEIAYKDRLIKATFPDCYELESYDARYAPCAPEIIKYFFKCKWIELGYNLILVGGPGQGKTLLATSLGKAACLVGYTTLFVSCIELFHKLQKNEKTYGELTRGTLYAVRLLIIDDIGHARPSTAEEATAFFRLIEFRVSNRLSTIFTSNSQPKYWPRSFGGATETTRAALDRILYRSYYLPFKGTKSKRIDAFKKLNAELRNQRN